jgi:hypothetical protein
MSSIVNKIKDAVHSNKHSEPEGTHGPHNSRIANTADPRVDSDRDHSHTLGNKNNQGYTASDNYAFGSTGPASHTAGPHESNTMNKADPRVDSDRDGSNRMNPGFGSGPAPNTAGPHQSDMMNKVDPRIDSDLDGSKTMGGNQGMSNTHGTHGTSGLTGAHGTSGLTGTHGTTGFGNTRSHAEGTHGPHNSRMANAADPRVDSDRDGSRTLGGSTAHTGTHTTLGHTGAAMGGVHGTGPAPNTAGPHSSDMMNKTDPRVDSDLDGSKTFGGNKTYSQS